MDRISHMEIHGLKIIELHDLEKVNKSTMNYNLREHIWNAEALLEPMIK